MNVAFRFEPPPDDPSLRFPSLSAFREAHTDLLQKRREAEDMLKLLPELEDFVRRGQATGALLDAESDRMVAQSLLDYWAALLYRLDRRTVDATLENFDRSLAPELEDCPYVGLDPFREENHARFFGRRKLIETMIGQLADQRLLAIVGPSGSGKSSLVLGGLLPCLTAGAHPGSETWHYLRPMVPGSEPFRNLAAAALPSGTGTEEIGALAARLLHDPQHIVTFAAGDQPWVFVIDQFEELFTLCDDDATRQAFAQSLRALVDVQSPRHIVLLTLRSDYESYVTRLPALQPLFVSGQVRVTPLTGGELREAIERPAEIVGLKFEQGLVDALVHDLLGDPAGLPLLQFTLLKLWEAKDRNRVTWDAYKELGSGRSALARSAQTFFENELSSEEQVTARRILLRMVRPSGSLEVTSNRVRREALSQIEDPGRVERVLDKLIQAHLVRLTQGETPADVQVEVAHEALIRNWPTLVDWLEDERAQLLIRRRWETQAEEWARLGRGGSGLFDEVQLFEVERWLESADAARLGYSEALAQLVQASRETIEKQKAEQEAARRRELEQVRKLAEAERQRAEEKDQRLQEKTKTAARLRWLIAGLVIALGATCVFAYGFIVAERQRRTLAEYKAEIVEQEHALETRHNIKTKEDALRALRVADQRRKAAEAAQRSTEFERFALQTRIGVLEKERQELQTKLNESQQEVQRLRPEAAGYSARLTEALKEKDEIQKKALEQELIDNRRLEEEIRSAKRLEEEIKSLKEQVRRHEQRPSGETSPGPALPSSRSNAALPLQMGVAIGFEKGTTGRFCCYVRSSNRQDRQLYLLTLASVLRGEVGAPILRRLDAGDPSASAGPVAVLHWVGELGAIAKPSAGTTLDFNIPPLGKLNDIENTVQIGDIVVLSRSGGRIVSGRVLEVKREPSGVREVIINIPTTPDDAGAPVLSDDRDLIGMISRSEDGKSYVIHINQVLKELNVELVDERGRVLK